MPVNPPSPDYYGPPARQSGNGNKPIHRVVIHSTVSPCEPGGARNIAAYFRSNTAGGSAHYVVDPTETVQAAYDSVVCWHAAAERTRIAARTMSFFMLLLLPGVQSKSPAMLWSARA